MSPRALCRKLITIVSRINYVEFFIDFFCFGYMYSFMLLTDLIPSLVVMHLSKAVTYYTVSQKGRHDTLVHIFAKY